MDKFYKIGDVIVSEGVLRAHSVIDTDGQFIVLTVYKIDAGSPENAKRALDAIARVIGAEDLLASEPGAEGWIPWSGGECPVDEDADVQYRLRNGYEDVEAAGLLEWQHSGEGYGITAYRPVEEQP